MTAAEPGSCRFHEELVSLVGRHRSSVDEGTRLRTFEALATLERRALIGGASDRTLRDIAEARFLTGILRDAVRPSRPASLRTIRRAVAGPRPAGRYRTAQLDKA